MHELSSGDSFGTWEELGACLRGEMAEGPSAVGYDRG